MSKSCIVVLSYNHPDLTARAVESALKFCQNITPPKVPPAVLLVHNGSEHKHTQTLTAKFPKILHFLMKENRGYSGGVNSGFKHAIELGFDWLFLLTNDCNILELDLPDNTAKPAIIAPLIYRRKTNKIDSCGGLFYPKLGKIYHAKDEAEFQRYKANGSRKSDCYPYVPGSAFWLHRNIFNQIGKLDDSLGTYWEDVDYSARIFLKNYLILFNSKNKILHQVGKTNHKNTYYTTYLFQRNRRIVSKRYVGKNIISYLTLITILNTFLIRKSILALLKKDFQKFKIFLEIYISS